jgi:hypothetical protein
MDGGERGDEQESEGPQASEDEFVSHGRDFIPLGV